MISIAPKRPETPAKLREKSKPASVFASVIWEVITIMSPTKPSSAVCGVGSGVGTGVCVGAVVGAGAGAAVCRIVDTGASISTGACGAVEAAMPQAQHESSVVIIARVSFMSVLSK